MRKQLSLFLVFSILVSALTSCTTTTAPRIPRNRIQTDAREPLPPVWDRQANSVYAQSRANPNSLIGPDGQKIPRSVRRMQALEAKQRRGMIDAPNEKKPTWKEKRLAAARERAEAEAAARSQAETSYQTRRTTTTSRPSSPSSQDTSSNFDLGPEFETSFSPATFDPADAIEETASAEAPEAPESTALVPTDLPFAVPIPGKDGYVTLPRGNSYRGEIDVRGIGSGTPVEIPDPNSPGNTVQFRVP